MHRIIQALMLGAVVSVAQAADPAPSSTSAPAAKPPVTETRKVEGTDNVYVFRYGNSQAMFVVTSDGVIATDPIGYGRPQAVERYIAEIRKVTDKPVRYVVYSHHHFDHIAGGRPFKEAGARFVAHERAAVQLGILQDPNTVLPDETVGDKGGVIRLGDTSLELHYIGRNHSDSTLIMRLPREKVIFAVDLMPVGTLPSRGMIDSYPLEWKEGLKRLLAMDWEQLIPGHPGAPAGRLGTKKDVQDILTFLQDASAAVQKEARAGKCWEPAEEEVKLDQYAGWPNYKAAWPFVVRRYCGLWGRGF